MIVDTCLSLIIKHREQYLVIIKLHCFIIKQGSCYWLPTPLNSHHEPSSIINSCTADMFYTHSPASTICGEWQVSNQVPRLVIVSNHDYPAEINNSKPFLADSLCLHLWSQPDLPKRLRSLSISAASWKDWKIHLGNVIMVRMSWSSRYLMSFPVEWQRLVDQCFADAVATGWSLAGSACSAVYELYTPSMMRRSEFRKNTPLVFSRGVFPGCSEECILQTSDLPWGSWDLSCLLHLIAPF